MAKKQFLAVCAILLATLFWGMTFAFIKQGVATLSPYNFLFWRFGIAIFILCLCGFRTLKTQKKAAYQAGGLLGIFLLGTVLFQTLGLQTLPASTSSFITGLSVILVPLLLSLTTRKIPQFKVIVAAVIAMVGIALISLKSGLSMGIGEFWTLLCALSFAIYILLAGKYSKGYNPIALSTFQGMVIFLVAGILAASTGTLTLPIGYSSWSSIIFCSVFASIFAFWLQLHFQKYISSTTTAIIFSCEPIFATLTAMVYLSEYPNGPFYIGASLIFIAILISEVKLKQKVVPQD